MAQYFQIQNFDELKRIYPDVQVVQVADDVGVSNHNRSQLLLQDNQLLLNEEQSTVYQPSANAQQQLQPQNAQTHYIIGDDLVHNQQQQHPQQALIQQQHQQQLDQQQHIHQQQQQEHQVHQQAQQIYYTSDQIMQPNSIVQHATHAQQQQQDIQQQQHLQHQQQQQQQQQNLHHPPPQPQQQIVYRMQPQQQQPQQQSVQQQSPQQQLLNNAHVIVQQPSGQSVLIQSPHQQEILMRQQLQSQRIIYNTNRVLYSQSPNQQQSQQQQNQQTILHTQQSNPVQQQQHMQIQASPMHQTRIVQTRVAPPQQIQNPGQNVVFHQVHNLPNANTINMQKQNQQQPPLPNQISIAAGDAVRGAIRTRVPRGNPASPRNSPSTRGSRCASLPSTPAVRASRPRSGTGSAPRLRGGRGGRGGAAGRGGTTVVNPISPNRPTNVHISMNTSPTHQQNIQTQDKNVAVIGNNQPQVKQIYRANQIPDPNNTQTQINLLQQQQQTKQLIPDTSTNVATSTNANPSVPKFRSPQTPLAASTPIAGGSNTNNFQGNVDLEDSIQAVVVKKAQELKASQPSTNLSTTLTTYYTKEEDDTRIVKTQNGTCMTLSEYKKRNPATTMRSIPIRPQSFAQKIQLPVAGQSATVPVARVNPSKVNTSSINVDATSSGNDSQSTSSSAPSVQKTSHNNYEIQTQNVLQNRNQQTGNSAEKDKNSAKMLVILASGEQRLITFTLPRESCTVQDLLEQVGVPFDNKTTIQCVENPGANIDFVVTVGFNVQESTSELISRAEQSIQLTRHHDGLPTSLTASASNQQAVAVSTTQSMLLSANSSTATQPITMVANAATTTTIDESHVSGSSTMLNKSAEDIPRKVIQGYFAVCQSCGFSGYDHAKCERCKRVFLEPPKRIPCEKSGPSLLVNNPSANNSSGNKMSEEEKKRSLSKPGLTFAVATTSSRGSRGGSLTLRGRGRSGRKVAESENVVVTLSSGDEEADDDTSVKSSSNVLAVTKTTQSFVYKSLSFEPPVSDKDESHIYKDIQRSDITDLSDSKDKLSTSLTCKSIRIGTYRFEPTEPVKFTSKGFLIVAPHRNSSQMVQIHIHTFEIVKIVYHFTPPHTLLCFYTFTTCADYMRESLGIKFPKCSGYEYFSSMGPCQFRRITLIGPTVTPDIEGVLQSIWKHWDELSANDAKDLLQRLQDFDTNVAAPKNKDEPNQSKICQLLIYPQGKGGISINTEDYQCLATDQYLNDIIIDFYLKWVHATLLSEEEQEKTYIFSTFFYKRLTTLSRNTRLIKDLKETAAQKRHSRVRNWTKNVNLFEKDFIIIPINEQSHWFLAIICFPKLKGPVTFETNTPVALQPIKKQKKDKQLSLQIGNTTITPLTKRDHSGLPDICGVGDDDSERDEAEGDDSDLATDDSDFESMCTSGTSANSSTNSVNQPIKQPLILIFDSLAGASRSRVVATLRDYLTCEYKARIKDNSSHTFTKENMPGHCVKVPQQNNFTDCGLYLLQYVEQFFKDPIRDYRLPIRQLNNWFETIVVTRKREDISNLLQQLINERPGDKTLVLPKIPFPTLNGQLVEQDESFNEEHVEFEEEEMEEETLEEEEEEASSRDAKGYQDDSISATKTNSSNILNTSTTAVPTHGRKIVVKRRFALAPELPPAQVRNLLKIRKTDQ